MFDALCAACCFWLSKYAAYGQTGVVDCELEVVGVVEFEALLFAFLLLFGLTGEVVEEVEEEDDVVVVEEVVEGVDDTDDGVLEETTGVDDSWSLLLLPVLEALSADSFLVELEEVSVSTLLFPFEFDFDVCELSLLVDDLFGF